ncbi:hypothetical protein [Halorarius halobius]|uniref:hypothetical protein n=1 Tax=Halorarius halobius TaxID=2962671 RepID=UPI0020CFAD51|nr:hypothetical protein [Halorarius halobius]
MDPHLRDGLLAVCALGLLVVVAALAGAIGSLVDWQAAVVGVVGSLLLEALFLRYPDRSRELWERRPIQAAAFALIAGLGIAAMRSGLGWILAALAWGLVAYLLVLGVVVAGYPNPVARLAERG